MMSQRQTRILFYALTLLAAGFGLYSQVSAPDTVHTTGAAVPPPEFDRTAVPERSEVGPYLHAVSTLMVEHALQERLLEPAAEVVDHGLAHIPITLQCRGSFQTLQDFFVDLQNLPRLVQFEEVVFERHPTLPGQVQMRTRLCIFYQPRMTGHDVREAAAS